jgi:hypothetical protein
MEVYATAVFEILCVAVFLGSVVGFFITFDPIYFVVLAYMANEGLKGLKG